MDVKLLNDAKRRTALRLGHEYCTLEIIQDLLHSTPLCLYCGLAFDETKKDLKRSLDRLNGNNISNPYVFSDGKINCRLLHIKCNLDLGWTTALARYEARATKWQRKLDKLTKACQNAPLETGNSGLHPLEKKIEEIKNKIEVQAKSNKISLLTKKCGYCCRELSLYYFKPKSSNHTIVEFDVTYPTDLNAVCICCQSVYLGTRPKETCHVCQQPFNTSDIPWQHLRCEERLVWLPILKPNYLYPTVEDNKKMVHEKCRRDNGNWQIVDKWIEKCHHLRAEWHRLWTSASIVAKELTNELPKILKKITRNFQLQTWQQQNEVDPIGKMSHIISLYSGDCKNIKPLVRQALKRAFAEPLPTKKLHMSFSRQDWPNILRNEFNIQLTIWNYLE